MSVQSLSHRQCLLPHPTHHHKCHLSMAETPPNKTIPPMVSQRLHNVAPCCPPAASRFPHWPLTACHLPFNAGVGHCRLTPGQSSGFNQCAAHCPNKIKKGKHSVLKLFEYNSCNTKTKTLKMDDGNDEGDGGWRWQLQWPTVTETAMADGKGNNNSNG